MAGLAAAGWKVARGGGDVFAVLPPALAFEQVSELAPIKQLAAVLAKPFVLSVGVCVQLFGSIGAAVSSGETASAVTLLRNAEIAMYRAKSSRQAWALYDTSLDEQAAERLLRVAELREAIAEGQLTVHYRQ